MTDKIVIKELEEKAKEYQKALDALHRATRKAEDQLKESFTEATSSIDSGMINLDLLEEFFAEMVKRPYGVQPRGENEWMLWIPKIWNLHYGWFEREEGIYNIYIVNRYFDLIQPVPEVLKEELDLSRIFNGLVVDDGKLIVADPEKDPIEKVKKRYAKFISKKLDDQTLAVKKGQEFDLIASIIRDGILPFASRPVDQEDLLDRHISLDLREYQERDLQKFLEYGAVGIFYPMGMGKTIIALEIMSRLKGRKLVLVPSVMLREQWYEKIQKYTDLDPSEYLVEVYHVNNIPDLMRESWSLVIYDEMHRLPANTYLELATLQTKYRLNMTATPFREDGRIDLVWALSGMPLGVDWNYFLERGLIIRPEILVYIERSMDAKRVRLFDLLADQTKTLIFCDSIKLGEDLADQYDIPFVHGQTNPADRMDIIRSNETVIVSRVGDLGISVEDLKRVIEFDFLFGSRSQELQRLGRLFHADFGGQHIIIMTTEEYIKYRKRLFGIYEKGFKVDIIRGQGVPSDLSLSRGRPPATRSTTTRPAPKKSGQVRRSTKTKKHVDADLFPIFDERRKLDRDLVIEILQSDYAKHKGGLEVGDIRDIMRHNNLKFTYRKLRDLVYSMWKSHEIGGRIQGQTRRYFPEGGYR